MPFFYTRQGIASNGLQLVSYTNVVWGLTLLALQVVHASL